MPGNVLSVYLALLQICLPGALGMPLLFDRCLYARDVCPNEHVKFWLYKNDTQHHPALLDPLNLTSQVFAPHLPLKVLVHGFTGHRDLSPNAEVRPVLLHTQRVHVLTVDYGALARGPCYYPWAVYNAPIVARCLAQLLDTLIARHIYTSEELHIIGFSLGAQIAGLTANFVQHRLKRLTGLDPARPAFMTDKLAEKLDASDADFVDVIHTDPLFFALMSAGGHADFYPNLEFLSQPGCSYWQDGRVRNCNHYRAPLYYAESITSRRGFWGYNCGSWSEFLMQRCNGYLQMPSAQMGYFVAPNASGSYFLTTNTVAPFAKGPLVGIELDVSHKGNETFWLNGL